MSPSRSWRATQESFHHWAPRTHWRGPVAASGTMGWFSPAGPSRAYARAATVFQRSLRKITQLRVEERERRRAANIRAAKG